MFAIHFEVEKLEEPAEKNQSLGFLLQEEPLVVVDPLQLVASNTNLPLQVPKLELVSSV